uniref:Putative secreted protein n=1 Tax=Ixodes ricinus TaxID=34613 RepID=A0A6B0TXX6_IXORI
MTHQLLVLFLCRSATLKQVPKILPSMLMPHFMRLSESSGTSLHRWTRSAGGSGGRIPVALYCDRRHCCRVHSSPPLPLYPPRRY